MRRIAVPLFFSVLILFSSCGHRTTGKQSVESILQKLEEHRVSDEEIAARIQSAFKDSSRLNALSDDEMTVDACLLREGMPTDMFVYGDTTELSYGGYSFVFVNDTLDCSIID